MRDYYELTWTEKTNEYREMNGNFTYSNSVDPNAKLLFGIILQWVSIADTIELNVKKMLV